VGERGVDGSIVVLIAVQHQSDRRHISYAAIDAFSLAKNGLHFLSGASVSARLCDAN
jgi:hypothetical protein